MTARATVDARDLSYQVADHVLVNGASLRVNSGETLALLGPNGAGKSTLLDLLGLLRRPKSGQVMLEGRRVDALRGRALLEARRQICCVYQEPLLLDRSVRFNVELGLRLRRIPGSERRARAHESLRRLGILHLAERGVHGLSGGEAKRASIARALAIEPRLLLLDEPFAGLDDVTRRQLLVEMGDLIRSSDMAAVLVTHDRAEARALSSKTAIMFDGRIVQMGATEDVLANPCTSDVATFLGFENRLEGKVISSADGLILLETAEGLRLHVAGGTSAESMNVMFRAEDLRLRWNESEGAGPNRFRATIRQIVSEGFPTRLSLDMGVRLSALITTRIVERRGLQVGDTIGVELSTTALKAYPRGT